MSRRRSTFAIRCWQMLATAVVMVAVGIAIYGFVRVLEWAVTR